MNNRVVVTGLGAVTPIGNNVEDFWNGIKEGKCGVTEITAFDTSDYKVKLAAEIKDFNPADYMDKRDARRMARFSQLAVAAATEAVKNSGINLDEIDKEKFGVIVGSGIGGLGTIEDEHDKMVKKGPKRISPLFIPMAISNMAAGNVAIKFGAQGYCTNVVTACASGTHSIGDAYRLLQMNRADIMLAGGTESTITPLGIGGFQALTALSTNTDPKRASIPFDKERDGFVMGEGAGMIVLETLEHAQKRGAKIYAEVVGYGANCDANHITSPREDGKCAARAMKMSIEEAGIDPEQVSYINAHGTSTPTNDRLETLSIKKVFGESANKIPVSSTKSMTGHLLGAAGAVEAIVCVKAIEDQFIPATIGYQVEDEECDLDYVANTGRKAEIKYTLSNSLGFGGHNATLLLKKFEE